jgi:hypothetical protein
MTAGLYQLAKTKRQQAEWLRRKMETPQTDPRIAHECEVSAAQLEKDADGLLVHAKENETLILSIETLVHFFNHSPHQSDGRTLALRHLEDASMRLRRETGQTNQAGGTPALP